MKGKENKPHIGIFGRRNNGKSSLINAITGQETAIVDASAGTTTDPVRKSIEIFGIGPAVIIDTAGIDDEGTIGQKRIQKSLEVLKSIDFAILVTTNHQCGQPERMLMDKFHEYEIPFLLVNNKTDLATGTSLPDGVTDTRMLEVSAKTGQGISVLLEALVEKMPPSAYISHSLLGDIIGNGDTVVLVTPIDSEAPEGRLILPQVQMIRDILDNDAVAVVLKEDKVGEWLRKNPAPRLVVTDSQMFKRVAQEVPEEVPLTGFSIVLARHKGDFEHYLEGTPHLSQLRDGDRILMLESCTHLTSCEDIGRGRLAPLDTPIYGQGAAFRLRVGPRPAARHRPIRNGHPMRRLYDYAETAPQPPETGHRARHSRFQLRNGHRLPQRHFQPRGETVCIDLRGTICDLWSMLV